MHTTILTAHQSHDHGAKFVPESARRLLAAGTDPTALAMHEGDVSVLFLDISGYSRLSQQMSASALNALVKQYFSLFLDHIHAAAGDINEIAAVDTSCALIEATEVLNHTHQEQPLTIHIGLNSGLALVGLTRLEGLYSSRWTFTARSAMTNLVARLAALAKLTASAVLSCCPALPHHSIHWKNRTK